METNRKGSPKRPQRSLTAHYSSCLLFDPAAEIKLKGLAIASCNPGQYDKDEDQDNVAEEQLPGAASLPVKLTVPDLMTCSCCQVAFSDREEQRNHFKSDWHRYNLHNKLKGLMPVTEDKFEEISGDVSSISGSEDEEEDKRGPTSGTSTIPESLETEMGMSARQERKFHKVYFTNSGGEMISLHKCLLHHKKDLLEPAHLERAAAQLPRQTKWIILMVSAGHFAGAVFQGKQILEHKTFHRYTVRAKRGTAQSTKDKKSHANSAGANLRRYNEAALTQEVQELMSLWSDHFKTCHLMFVRIPANNRAMFYAGKNPVLKKEDWRIRVIPFATRRPTFSEAKRVHQMLASVECYGQAEDVQGVVPLSPPRYFSQETEQLEIREPRVSKPQKREATSQDRTGPQPTQPRRRSKSREKREAAVFREHEGLCEPDSGNEDGSDGENDVQLVESMQSIDLTQLREFETSPRKKHAKKKMDHLKQKEKEPDSTELDEDKLRWRNRLFTACKMGNVESLQSTLLDMRSSMPSTDSQPSQNSSEPQVQTSDETRSTSQVQTSDETRSTSQIQTEGVSSPPSSSVDGPLDCDKGEAEPHCRLTSDTTDSLIDILNNPIGDNKITFLHLAAREGHAEIATALLISGADPTVKDGTGKLAYNVAEIEVRNALRRFMAAHPTKYDYTKAQIPSPLTAEMENDKKMKMAERRKQKKKAAQEKNKEKKAEEAQTRSENQEKERFLKLSDREKRALAAERRLLQQHSDSGIHKTPVMSRCFQCGTDITGKVPFEYSDYKFCTTKCLREHRSSAAS